MKPNYNFTLIFINFAISIGSFSVVKIEVFKHIYLFPNVTFVKRHHLIVGCETQTHLGCYYSACRILQ
jgi:hypothetical protein